MRGTFMIVGDSIRDGKNKKGEPVQYRTITCVDQDPKGATLKTMLAFGVQTEEKLLGVSPAGMGKVVNLYMEELGENYLGPNGRAVIEEVLGTMTITPAKKAA